MDRSLDSVGRVLVKEVNWLGDLVMSLPALKAVRQRFPRAHLAVLLRSELAGFFEGAEWVDEVIPYRLSTGWRGLRDRWQIIADIRRRHFDLAVLLPRSFDSALWPALAGVPRRAGVNSDARGWLLTDKTVLKTRDPSQHQVHAYLQMLHRTLGIEGAADAYRIDVPESQRHTQRTWLAQRRRHPQGPLIALAPAAAFGPAKEWPISHYGALIDGLAEQYDAECVLVGGPNERAKCEAVAAATRHGAIVAAGDTTIGQLIGLLSLCDAFAGNDSGAMHIAGALGIPTVGLFGSTNPVRTGPLGPRTTVLYHRLDCSPCLQRTCRFGHYNCLQQITVGEVVDALRRLGVFA